MSSNYESKTNQGPWRECPLDKDSPVAKLLDNGNETVTVMMHGNTYAWRKAKRLNVEFQATKAELESLRELLVHNPTVFKSTNYPLLIAISEALR